MKNLIAIVLPILLVGCVAKSGLKPIVYDDHLIGTWTRTIHMPDESWFEEITYSKDGRKCSYSISFYPSGKTSVSFYESRWKINGQNIEAEVVKSTSKYVPVGQRFTDKIESLLDGKLIIQMTRPFIGDEKEIFYKSQYERNGKICVLVQRHIDVTNIELRGR